MYNENLKARFIKERTTSMNTVKATVNIFNLTEKYEEKWGSDLCTMKQEDLQIMANEITGLRVSSQINTLITLKEYVKWCIKNGVEGACDAMLKINDAGVEKMKYMMVASPLHLQTFLNECLDPESEETIDNTYRCYYWMAFGGFTEEESISICNENIDLENMEIRYKDKTAVIYREALPAFKNCMFLKEFLYKHPNYTNPIRRDRIERKEIVRGIKADPSVANLRSTLSHRNNDALEESKTKMQLSYNRVYLSGLFYRMYDYERAGFPVDFTSEVRRDMEGKTYSLPQKEGLRYKENRIKKQYMDDYQRWKLAFSI